MNARYTYGGHGRGGGRRVDSGFNSVSARRLTDAIPRLLNGGFITVLECDLILHVYFADGAITVEYYPSRGARSGWEAPVSVERLTQLLELIEAGSDPTEFVAALPRLRPTPAT